MTEAHDLMLKDPWTVGTARFPADGTARDKLLFLLNYAVLAPSIVNTQPWRFRLTADGVSLYASPSRVLPVVDPAGRELTISCGAALLNLRVAVRGFGYEPVVRILPDARDPDRLADVTLTAGGTSAEDDRRLCNAIPARRTSRAPFERRVVPGALLDEISHAATVEGCALSFIHDADGKRRVGALVAKAVRLHLADPAFRRELSEWVSERISEAYDRYGEEFRHQPERSDLAGRTPPPVDERALSVPSAAGTARMFADADRHAADAQARAEAAPALALLTTQADARPDWLTAGQALERALLTATAGGLVASYDSPPLEIPDLRPQIAETFGVRGRPQILLRLGYGPQIPPSPRRPVGAVVA